MTGGLGFIGRHLVGLLHERGDPVRVLDLAAPTEPLDGVEYVTGSILDADAILGAMEGVERVCHLAAKPDLWAHPKDELMRVNYQGTRHVVAAAVKAGVERFVHTSSAAILNDFRGRGSSCLVDESISPSLDDMPGLYCRSKLLAEQEALSAASRGLSVVVLNPTLPIGPGDVNLTPPTRMLLGFLNGRYPSFLEARMNLVDVRDVARGHLAAAERGRSGERYILGCTNIALSQLLQLLQELTGLPVPRHSIPYWVAWGFGALGELVADAVTHRPPSAPLTGVRLARAGSMFDNRRAQGELGLSFRGLAESLRDAIRWYETQGLLERALRKAV
ncbi:MAG: NAD-dependent epimerase/dehydratase family protein [Pseudomonadota bacterium]|nr:NAD-dependent epimerase/dehydratase family protein [Pseudomonadota bacterium]